jgi:drug/metabolite transporter (DMT)-like permease
VFLALSPLTAALLGAVLLGEPVGLLTWLGLGAVAFGLGLAHR